MTYPKGFLDNFEKANNGDFESFNKLIDSGCFSLGIHDYHGCNWAGESQYICKTKNLEIWEKMRKRLLSDKSLREHLLEDENSEYYFGISLDELKNLPFN